MNKACNIYTNVKGYKVLRVKGIVRIDSVAEIKGEDFDVIYIEDTNQSHYELSYQLQQLSTFKSYKCFLKPMFLAPSLKNRVTYHNTIIDGYAATPDQKDMNERVDEIYERLAKIDTFEISEVRSSSYIYFLKLCKYAISRGMFTFTNTVEEAYAQGHSALYVAKRNNIVHNLNEDFIKFNHTLLELGYATVKSFEERIHLCPKCSGSHLFYMETCPQCGSSNLKDEPVLHHFRCANISPESSYAYSGELRCPKCHRFLRHIGVDYDRPSNVYNCRQCNHTFMHTRMKVYCSTCNSKFSPAELLANDIYTYEYTPDGVLALSSNDAAIAVSRDIWAGYSKFDSFLSQIRLYSYSHEKNETIYVNCFKVDGNNVTKDTVIRIVEDMQKRYHYNNISYNGSRIFMAVKSTVLVSDELNMQAEHEYEEMLKIIDLKYSGVAVTGSITLKQGDGERLDDFIERLKRLS